MTVELKRDRLSIVRGSFDVAPERQERLRLERHLSRRDGFELLPESIAFERIAHRRESAGLVEHVLRILRELLANVGALSPVHLILAAVTGGRFVAALEEELSHDVLEDQTGRGPCGT